MSEPTEPVEDSHIYLTIEGKRYDITVIAKALAYAHDAAVALDVQNAAKNLSEVRFSRLTELLSEAQDLLKEIFTVHAVAEPSDVADQSAATES